jgi:hypothetical protein
MKLNRRQYLAACTVAGTLGLAALATACQSAPTPVPTVTKTVTARPVPAITVTAKPKPRPAVTKTVTASPAQTAPAAAAAPQAQFTNAVSVIDQFYQDLTDRNYSAAWNLGGDNLSGGTGYSAWAAGYDTTASLTLYDTANFGSDQVTAYLSAVQDNGSIRTYYGTYNVSDGVITSANIVQES